MSGPQHTPERQVLPAQNFVISSFARQPFLRSLANHATLSTWERTLNKGTFGYDNSNQHQQHEQHQHRHRHRQRGLLQRRWCLRAQLKPTFFRLPSYRLPQKPAPRLASLTGPVELEDPFLSWTLIQPPVRPLSLRRASLRGSFNGHSNTSPPDPGFALRKTPRTPIAHPGRPCHRIEPWM
ncbi:hypothetical protein CSOJ01_08916 [Colletotrichum sojae]|uniref:Uncharacterized protein n=1 Tax=Colletotrichum sojae TaxID=2175907 RepID=A0A8H6J5D6_9PEZI|nr:hypothetical protein CSOJ01_08916 [Colletotrichum sojae]